MSKNSPATTSGYTRTQGAARQPLPGRLSRLPSEARWIAGPPVCGALAKIRNRLVWL